MVIIMMEQKKIIDVVLVGIGGYGAIYVKDLFEDVNKGLCRWVGVVDPAAEKAPAYSRIVEAGIPVYRTLEDFYAEHQADLACIAVPIQFHTPFTVCAIAHGSHVLCEKPLSGAWEDAVALEALSEKTGKFIMSGYQWSHSPAILALKRDILDGRYGKPVQLKTLILWPRRQSYFRRGTGWAGKKYAADGTPILDSVASNAAAHYLHNMLFLLGDAMDRAAIPETLDAELFRANPIENFDTSVIRAHLPGGAEALFIASHATSDTVNPRFVYAFEKGTVTFSEEEGVITGVFADGETKVYGDPFADQAQKIRIAIANAAEADPAARQLPCTPYTAMAHAKCIAALKDAPIVTAEGDLLETVDPDGDPLQTIPGLSAALRLCYERGCMLHEAETVDVRLTGAVKPVVNVMI